MKKKKQKIELKEEKGVKSESKWKKTRNGKKDQMEMEEKGRIKRSRK
jgi:hypothetical protein